MANESSGRRSSGSNLASKVLGLGVGCAIIWGAWKVGNYYVRSTGNLELTDGSNTYICETYRFTDRVWCVPKDKK